MEHLSSCYFCGAAVESDVREYPIVTGSPESLDLPPVEERPTVTLCVTCRRKLDRLLAAGIGVADSIGVGTGAAPSGDEASTGASGETDVRANAAVSGDETDAGGDDDGPRASTDEGDDAPSIDPDAEIFGDTDPVAPGDGTGDGSEADPDDPQDVNTSTDGQDVDTSDGHRDGSASDDANASENVGDDGGTSGFSTSQAAGGRATSSHGERTDADDGGDDTGGDTDDAGDGVSREAYNKVVRLLQNRDFPVERGDIVAVATNAYGLGRRDCEAAIDALVAKGIVEADGDRLLRPDD